MHTLQQALEQLIGTFPPQAKASSVAIDEACNHILAEDIYSSINVPSFDNSAMDGYVFYLDSSQQAPLKLSVSLRIQAGDAIGNLEEGTAARIFTGAAIPTHANTVVIQENCTVDGECVTINKLPKVGENIRRAGEDISKNELILTKGTKLNLATVGILASVGISQCLVYKPLKIGLLSTGSELVMPGEPLQQGQIYNSNGFVLNELCKKHGYEVALRRHVTDDYQATKQLLLEMSEQVDVVISSGGVSVGEEDHVKAVLEEIGELNLWKIAMKPGKPLVAGKIYQSNRQVAFFGLPGNPVSSYITFKMAIVPVLASLQGEDYSEPLTYSVESTFNRKGGSRLEFVRVSISSTGSITKATTYPNQSSGVISSIAKSDGVIIHNIGQDISVGDTLVFLPFNNL